MKTNKSIGLLIKTLEEFKEKQLNVLVKCVTNTPIAKEIALKLANILDKKTTSL